MGLREAYVSPEKRVEKSFTPEPSTFDVMQAAVGQSLTEGLTSSIGRLITSKQKEDEGEKLTPDQAVKEYKIGIKPDEEKSRGQLEWMQDNYLAKQKRDMIMQNGPDNFFSRTVVPFAGRMAGAMMDPLELGIGFALGAGTGKILISAAKAGKTIGGLGKFGIAAAENFIASGISASFEVAAAEEAGIDYTAEEAFRNVVFSSLAFTGAFHGGSAMIGKLKKLGDPALTSASRYYDSSMDNGLVPDLPSISRAIDDLSVDDATDSIVRNLFPEKTAQEILEGAELKRDVSINIQRKVMDGELTEIEADKFLSAVDDAGLKREAFDPELNNVYMDAEQRKAMSQNQIKADEAEKMPDIDEGAMSAEDATFVKQSDEIIARAKDMEKQGILPDEGKGMLETIRKEASDINEELKIADAMANCLGG